MVPVVLLTLLAVLARSAPSSSEDGAVAELPDDVMLQVADRVTNSAAMANLIRSSSFFRDHLRDRLRVRELNLDRRVPDSQLHGRLREFVAECTRNPNLCRSITIPDLMGLYDRIESSKGLNNEDLRVFLIRCLNPIVFCGLLQSGDGSDPRVAPARVFLRTLQPFASTIDMEQLPFIDSFISQWSQFPWNSFDADFIKSQLPQPFHIMARDNHKRSERILKRLSDEGRQLLLSKPDGVLALMGCGIGFDARAFLKSDPIENDSDLALIYPLLLNQCCLSDLEALRKSATRDQHDEFVALLKMPEVLHRIHSELRQGSRILDSLVRLIARGDLPECFRTLMNQPFYSQIAVSLLQVAFESNRRQMIPDLMATPEIRDSSDRDGLQVAMRKLLSLLPTKFYGVPPHDEQGAFRLVLRHQRHHKRQRTLGGRRQKCK